MPPRGTPRTGDDPGNVAEERAEAQRSFAGEHERQKAEKHYWITFHKMGETDQVRTVHIGAAGVAYNIVKGERVPLPQSAINALELAVRVGLDHGHPIDIGGKKYLRKIRESDYSYTIHGECSAEEAADWREGIKRAEAKFSDLHQVSGPVTDDLVEVGTI